MSPHWLWMSHFIYKFHMFWNNIERETGNCFWLRINWNRAPCLKWMSDMQTRWNIWEFGLFTFNKSILWWELHVNKYLPKRQEAQILRPVALKLTTENYCTKVKKCEVMQAKRTFRNEKLYETFFEESKGHFEIHCWAST